MPIYEYDCTACHKKIEKIQKVSDPALQKCPYCQQESLQRLVSAPSVRLKGNGWYETDFKGNHEHKKNLHTSDTAASPVPSSTPPKTDKGTTE